MRITDLIKSLFILVPLSVSACQDWSSIQKQLGTTRNSSDNYDPKAKLFQRVGEYSVYFPVEPTYHETFLGNGGSQFDAVVKGEEFSIAEAIAPYGLPDMTKLENHERVFEELARRNVESWAKGTESSHYSVGLEGGRYPGRHVEGTSKDGRAFIFHIYVDGSGQRLFLTGVKGSQSAVNSSESQRFLTSLSIAPKVAKSN